MSGGGGRLSKVGTVLIIIFAVALLMLLTQLFYVLWRRRVFRRLSNGGDRFSQHSSSDSTFSTKELLYFFCVRPQSNSITAPDTADDLSSNPPSEMEVIDVDLLKIHGMFGPPRFLFTIKEEEGEHTELPAEIPLRSSAEEGKKMDDGSRNMVTLQERFEETEESPEAVTVEIDDQYWSDTTPCDSPMYFTPMASPVGEVICGLSTEADVVCGSRTAPLLKPVGQ